MKAALFVFLLSFSLCLTAQCQEKPTWENLNWLSGQWIGEGGGKPGQGTGEFSFTFDLDKKILVRKSHSEYPATNDKPLIIHDDLIIIYPDDQANPSKAIYFDNEGHVINYLVSVTGNSVIFTSEKKNEGSVFRLSYISLDRKNVDVKFEISRDGEHFATYVEGKSIKKDQ
jgi:hypothetical protein